MNYASFNELSPDIEDKVVKMKTELATLKDQMYKLLASIAFRPDVSKHFVTMAPSLVHASNNDV